ncbi:hypothetical protein GCM10020000_64790 [Streptomyces olivoverticillatus]
MPLVEIAADLVGVAAHRHRAVLVDDRAVVRQPVDLVVLGAGSDLGDDQLNFVRLLPRAGEDGAEGLRIDIGKAAGGDVLAVVGVAAQVGVAHAADAQVLELVVLAHRREGDPVVDLADLVQGAGRVLGDEDNAIVVLEDHDAAAARDALAGVLGAVGHGLLR